MLNTIFLLQTGISSQCPCLFSSPQSETFTLDTSARFKASPDHCLFRKLYWEMLSIKAPAITDRTTKVTTRASDNSIQRFPVLTRWDWVQPLQSMCSCWHLPGSLFILKAKMDLWKTKQTPDKRGKSVFMAL